MQNIIDLKSINLEGSIKNNADGIQEKSNLFMQQDTSNMNILDKFKLGEDIRHLLSNANKAELEGIASLIRHRILEVVSKNGGHLSSTLGAVELILGMHVVFDCKLHPFIYDVSHQAYAHKLLTGRYKDFETLRQFNGISGFLAPYESNLDYFIAGHSSTSLSLAVGSAKAKKLNNDIYMPLAMIGDGSMSAGLVYEAMNELGDLKLPVVIILNDNEMSIAKPIGAISKILSKTIASPLYQSMKEKIKKIVDKMPNGTTFIAKRFEESFKLITPGLLFEEFGIDYIGPIDGNDIEEVVATLKSVKNVNRPVLIHCQTIKGKGYKIAEGRYEKWHGVAPFDLSTGKTISTNAIKSPTAVFSNKLLSLAKNNQKIVGVTAAMPSGTGLDKLIDEFPNRFFDVAIAEQHAVTSMAAMAKEGYKPYIAIYSTFLQRAFDQIVHDVCIMNLGVVFCIDRAGIVGEDGETHQGLLDISYLQGIPNISLMAPRDNDSLECMLEFSQNFHTPLAIRYPRGKFALEAYYTTLQSMLNTQEQDSHISDISDIILRKIKDIDSYNLCLQQSKSQMLFSSNEISVVDSNLLDKQKHNILLVGYGNGVGRMVEVFFNLYINHSIVSSILDLVSIKPIDKDMLRKCFSEYDYIFIMSDNYKINGVGSTLMRLAFDLLNKNEISKMPKIASFELEDVFAKHGNTQIIEENLKIDSKSIAKNISLLIN